MNSFRVFCSYLEKISLGVWGLNIVDLLSISDVSFLKGLDEGLSVYLGVIGAIYLTIQIPFKVIELNQKRKSNIFDNALKQEDLKAKKKNQKDLKNISDRFTAFDAVHEK